MITSASFVISSPDVMQCPQTTIPEYAFIGRSNVGKSSLINMLTHNPKLAKTSQKTGKTLLINHFLINAGTDTHWHLVDLPGYGFAQAGKKQRAKLKMMIERYCLLREALVSHNRLTWSLWSGWARTRFRSPSSLPKLTNWVKANSQPT